VNICPAWIFREGMRESLLIKKVMAGCICLMLIARTVSSDPLPPGYLEGHLKIFPLSEVEPADREKPEVTAETYKEYPLIILSRDKQKEVARVAADRDGNYRVPLPPGDYILDVQGRERERGHVRAKPQPFTVVSNQTVRVDMDIDTGIR
jgi:hypothetical protein